jgi:DNA-binding NarL/FixJ family response regulator
MNSTLPPAVGDVARLADLIGLEAALALIEAYGGTRVYIPHEPTEWLTDLVGAPAAGRQWRVLVYKAQGLSRSAIARRLVCTESAVGRILRTNGLTQPQLDLFQR